LKPGTSVLEVKAPSYIPQTIAVKLSRGTNRLKAPVALVGYEIPKLKDFILFEDWSTAGELGIEIRPRSTDGQAVVNHPALDIRIIGRISAQMRNRAYAQAPTESGSARGEELYWGLLSWKWDPLPETVFRYHASVPLSRVAWSPAPYWVIDYVILLPDPRRITAQELDEVSHEVLAVKDPMKIPEILNPYKDRVRTFLTTTWNVKVGG
jgi:hypothetical protein